MFLAHLHKKNKKFERDSLTSTTDERFIQIHTSSCRIMVRVSLVRRRRRLWLRVEEPLIALGHHVSSLTAPVLETRKALGVRPLPGGRARIVIHVVYTAARVASHLPARWQRLGSLPWCWSRVMVHIVSACLRITVRVFSSLRNKDSHLNIQQVYICIQISPFVAIALFDRITPFSNTAYLHPSTNLGSTW